MEYIGIIGAILYLFSYAKIQWRRDYAKTIEYSALNFLASSFVLYSLLDQWNLPSVIIQISWMTISAYGVYRCLKYKFREKRELLKIQALENKST